MVEFCWKVTLHLSAHYSETAKLLVAVLGLVLLKIGNVDGYGPTAFS